MVLAHPKSFVIPVFHWLAPSTPMSGKHFVLKELPFNEVAQLADVEARQARLDA